MEIKSKLRLLVVGTVLVLLTLSAWIVSQPDDEVRLVFCDVGQGDASLITYGTNQILVDGGPNQKVINCLTNNIPFWDRDIEMVVLTHPEADHLTGIIDALDRYNVKYFVINNISNDKAIFWAFRQKLLAEGTQIYAPKDGDQLKIGSLRLNILWPNSRLGDPLVWNNQAGREQVLGAATYNGKMNDSGIVMELEYGNFKVLFPADIDEVVEKSRSWEDVDVLKVAHHGSKYSTSTEFLEQVKPEVAVISVGNNTYGHPTEETLRRLKNKNIKILRTDQDGQVIIETDGKSYQTYY